MGTVVVDGNNVMGAAADGWWRDRPAAARRLLARLQAYGRASGDRVVLVLDVPQADLPEGDAGGVEVRYPARRGRDAGDERVVDLLDGELAGDEVEVVTSDRALRDAASARPGVSVTGAGAFLRRLDDLGC
ncbi:MAG TPA: NYN domain-containing protein [Acidimicrobiales bacterium]